MTDDQGYGDLSCHGNPNLKTPNLDKLYAESIRFTDLHVAPMCTPTRSELLTGQQAFRNGAAFGDPFTGFTTVPGRDVAKAVLRIGGDELTEKTAPTESCASFTVALEKGEEQGLQSWLYDKAGNDLGGAFFVDITIL